MRNTTSLLLSLASLALGAAACKDAARDGSDVPAATRSRNDSAGDTASARALRDQRGESRASQKDVTQVAQPATGDTPGAMAGPAARQDTAAGTTLGNDRIVDGKLVQASSDRLLLDAPNEHGLLLRIDEGTTIERDGKKVRASELTEGAEVRASYRLQGQEKIATHIEGGASGKLHPADAYQQMSKELRKDGATKDAPVKDDSVK